MATIALTAQQISDFESTGKLELPAGNYSVDQTIDLGTCNGGRLSGAGQSYSPTETSNDKQVTRLFWTGTAGEPMIKGYIRGLVVEDIMLLDGRIWIEPKRGFGTGVCQFNRVSFFGDNSGVLFGDVSFNGNAADSRFRDCQFNKCDPCIETTTAQNVNFGVSDSLFYRCGPVFLVNGGGLMNVDNCYMTQVPEVFRLTGNGTMTGSQNNKFSITNIRYDANQDVQPKVVVDTGSYGDRVLTIINPHWPPQGIEHVDIQGGASWTIRGLEISEVEIMSATPIKDKSHTFNVSLISDADGDILTNPTIEAGDFQITTDGGSLKQLDILPQVKPPNSGVVAVSLTIAEVGSSRFTVLMSDQDGEWRSMNYHQSVADADDFKSDVSSISAGVIGLGQDLSAVSSTIGSPSDLGSGGSISSNLNDIAGAGFSNATDSLHSIRLRGDDAWVTADNGESVGANRLKAW